MNSGFTFGQSGASIEVITRRGKSVVLKRAKDPQAAKRLELQHKKHVDAFESGRMGAISTPEPLGAFRDGGYTMEHIHGIPVGSLLQVGSRYQFKEIADTLSSYFLSNYRTSNSRFERNLALEKLDHLETKILAMGGQTVNFARSSLSRLREFFDHAEITESWNHGDLSLENLLFQQDGSKLYALDFLDSPFNALEIDMGRIWLDVDGGWWGAGTQPSATTRANLIELRFGLERCFKSLNVNVVVLEAFSTLAALRVLPYTSNPVRRAFLQNALVRYLG